MGWAVVRLAAGLSVDLAYRYLPRHLTERTRAILMGIVLGVASFLLTLLAQAFFYRVPLPTDPGSFVGVAYLVALAARDKCFSGIYRYALSRNA